MTAEERILNAIETAIYGSSHSWNARASAKKAWDTIQEVMAESPATVEKQHTMSNELLDALGNYYKAEGELLLGQTHPGTPQTSISILIRRKAQCAIELAAAYHCERSE